MKNMIKSLLTCALALGFAPFAVASLTSMAKVPTKDKTEPVSYIDFAIKEKSGVTFPDGKNGFQRVNLSAGKPALLPDLIRNDSLDYEFDGWYDGETKITTSTVFSDYKVVYDKWTSITYDTKKVINSVSLNPALPTAGMTQSTYQAACGEITQSGLWAFENYKLYEGLNAKSGNELTGSVEANKNYSAKIVLGVDYGAGYRIGSNFMSSVTSSNGLISNTSYMGSTGYSSNTWSTDIRRVTVVINFTYNDFASYPKSQYASNGQSLNIAFETTSQFSSAKLLQKTGFSTWNDLYLLKDSSTSGQFTMPALYDTTAEFRIYVEFPGGTSLTGDSFTIVYGAGSSNEEGKFLIQPPSEINLALDESYVVQYLFNREFDNMWVDRWSGGYWSERVVGHNDGIVTISGYDFAISNTYRLVITYDNGNKRVESNTFTINWVDNANSWTVTLNSNTDLNEKIEINDIAGEYVVPECSFTAPAGKEFEQWVCDGVRYNPGDHMDIDRARSLFALWKSKIQSSYSITFASNGGSGTMNEVLATYNEEYVVPGCTFDAPAGKKFDSWWANGNTYHPGDTLVIKKDTQFAANWIDDTYEVTFNANGGSGDMSMVLDAPCNYTLPTCEFTAPAGKQFIGWALNDVNATPVGEGKEIKLTSNSTFYAIWDDNDPYVITYDDGNGNLVYFTLPEGSNYTVASFYELGFTAPAGKSFSHWRNQWEKVDVNPGDHLTVPGDDTYFKAQFVTTGENVYTISFNANGQSGEMDSIEVVEGTEFVIPKPEFTAPSGTEFAGWALNGDITKIYKPFDKITVNESFDLFAQWRTPKDLEAEYDGKAILGDKLSAENIAINLVYDDDYREPVLAGSATYSVNGTPIADIENYTFSEIGITAIIVSYDGYEATMGVRVVNEFHVSFDANGGKGDMESLVVNSSSYTLPNNGFTPVGNKEFKGWLVNGKEYNPGETVTLTGDTVIKAIWDSIYTVSFSSNGGTGSMVSASVKTGEFTLPQCIFTAPNGKEFAGWKINGAGDTLAVGAKINISADVELVAQWKDKSVDPEKTLESITLSGSHKTEFTVGDAFSAEGLVVTAHFSGGYEDEIIALSDVTISGYDMNKAGTQTVTVTYEGKTATYEITVKEAETPITPDVPVTPDNPSSGLPVGAVVGIIIGSALVIGMIGFSLVWFVIKKKTWADFIALFKKK